MTEVEYITVSETAKNIVITHKILCELSIISEDFVFLLLINNIRMIAISESKKVIRNARHIDIHYHHIWDLIDKKTIEVSHMPTGEMTADDLTKVLLLNKFKEFIELVSILKIETSSDGEISNSKASSNDKNNEKFMMNYYEAGEEADKEVSFKAEEAE